MNIFFIGDTHIGHRNIINFYPEHRPFNNIEDHDWEIIRRWNEIVNHNDTVFHLGDVVFGQNNMWKLGHLKGNKQLILGNHDKQPMREYLKYFTKIHGVKYIGRNDAILTHVPVHPEQLNRWNINIHGHLHAINMEDPRYVNVSCEQNELYPISWEQLQNEQRKKEIDTPIFS